MHVDVWSEVYIYKGTSLEIKFYVYMRGAITSYEISSH